MLLSLSGFDRVIPFLNTTAKASDITSNSSQPPTDGGGNAFALTSFMGVIFVILDRFTLFGSVGGIIANIFDIADGRWNGRIQYDIRLW